MPLDRRPKMFRRQTMTSKSESQKAEPKKEPTACGSCGRPLKRMSFRTGSMDKPQEDSLVCSHCGTRIATS